MHVHPHRPTGSSRRTSRRGRLGSPPSQSQTRPPSGMHASVLQLGSQLAMHAGLLGLRCCNHSHSCCCCAGCLRCTEQQVLQTAAQRPARQPRPSRKARTVQATSPCRSHQTASLQQQRRLCRRRSQRRPCSMRRRPGPLPGWSARVPHTPSKALTYSAPRLLEPSQSSSSCGCRPLSRSDHDL